MAAGRAQEAATDSLRFKGAKGAILVRSVFRPPPMDVSVMQLRRLSIEMAAQKGNRLKLGGKNRVAGDSMMIQPFD